MALVQKKLENLQWLLSHMPLEMCATVALPELGLTWAGVCKALRRERLPLKPVNVGRMVALRAARSNPALEDLEEVLAVIQIKMIGLSTTRQWYTVELQQPRTEVMRTNVKLLPLRVRHAVRQVSPHLNYQVHSCKLESFVYISVRTSSKPVLYVAVQVDSPIAFVSSLGNKRLLTGLAQGMGYTTYRDTQLHGRHIPSLLRIYTQEENRHTVDVMEPPEYAPRPVLTSDGVDYTNKTYNLQYVDKVLGHDPPVLNTLEVTSKQEFVDQDLFNGEMTVKIKLTSEHVAQTLREMVAVNALPPTSDWIYIFQHMKKNKNKVTIRR